MAKVKALQSFEFCIDMEVGRCRKNGEEWECTQERAEELVRHGYAVIVEPSEPQPVVVAKPEEIEEVKKPKRGRPKKS